ncbi:efflux RND transporter permease subunit [Staphylococcus sp. SS21]|nr:efflux RND transporter permease subunit [Staphylococcus singaporensis]
MIKKLLQFSLGNKFAIFLMVVLVVLGGVYASAKLKLELLPDVQNPVISVTTTMPGATPQSTQDEISSKIDNQVRSLAYVKDVKTQSIQNASIVTVEYENNTDMDKAEEQLKKEIDKIKFKDEVGQPELRRNSMDAFPVLAYSFSNKDNDLKKVTKVLNEQLIPKLQTVDGVQNAQLNGQTNREITLKFKQDELEKYGLTADDVENYLKTATRTTPLGLFQFGDKDKSIVVDGQYQSVDAFKNINIPLTLAGGQGQAQSQSGNNQNSAMSDVNQASQQTSKSAASNSISGMPTAKLKDLADITVGDVRSSISKTNGKDAVNLQITKAQDANTVQVAKDVQQKIDTFIEENKDLNVTKTMDTAKPVEKSLYTMVEKAALGTIVAIIVILLFLRNIRTTLISIISIPLSLLMALIALKLSNVSLNILTLGALTVAIGRVIDDSIVVVENIYRRLTDPEEKLKGENLIISATTEVFKPIMSSTLVTIIVFLPLVFVSGSVGEMFRPFALAIAFSLLASLLVSITLVPALASTLFKKGVKRRNKQHQEGLGVVSTTYKKVLKWSLNHKWIVIILSTLILILTIVFGGPRLGTSFISAGDDKFLAITYTPKPGETEQSVLNHAKDVEKYLKQKKHVKTIQYSVGGSSPVDPTGSTNSMAIMVEYDNDTPNFDVEADKVIKHVDGFKHPGEWKNQDLGTGAGNKSVEVTVKGPSTEAIKSTVQRIEQEMKQVKGLANVKSDLSQTYDQFEIKVDQNKAAENGISASQLAVHLNENLPEKTVTTVKENGKSIDVKVKQNKKTDWSEDKLNNITLKKPTGGTIKLGDIATLVKTTTPSKLTQEQGDYATTVSAKVTNKDVGGTTRQVMSKINNLDKPNNVKVNIGGASDDINNAMTQLAFAMLAAIIIVYLILVITFKGGLAPFTILFSLPFTVIGVIIALLITGETISVPSLIGMLMLIGIVVTNAIVLIDRVINNEQQGMEMKEALIEAGGTRIRPILMTAIATIGALVPLLFGQDSSILISKGLAATVIGGLISSTLLTLVVVPVIYEILFTLKNRITKR